MVTRYIKWIGEIASIDVAKERLALMAEKLEAKEDECSKLNEWVLELEAANAELGEQLRASAG